MNGEKQQTRASLPVRAGGCIVILATVLLLALAAIFFSAPWVFDHEDGGWLLVPTFIGSLFASWIGGFFMIAATKNPRWLFAPAIGSALMVLLYIFAKAIAIAAMH